MSHDDIGDGRRPSAGASRDLQVMPWWLVVAGLAVAVAAGWSVISWLLGEANVGTARAQARIDAVRTGLTVIAGTGGAVGLVLAARRQWLSERAQRHQERVAAETYEHQDRVQGHQEQVAEQTRRHSERLAQMSEYDATERRITDLYTKAVELLGSERAAVRLGGLHALERLAQDNPGHRQTIVDLLCAYLRMSGPDDATRAATQEGPHAKVQAEGQVKRIAAQLLTRHLRPGDEALYWPGTRLDLSGAELRDLDATGCTFAAASFAGTVFTGTTDFTGAVFDGPVRLDDARFTDGTALFHRLDCRSEAALTRAVFACPAEFDDARFIRPAWFTEAAFTQGASFRRVRFEDTATFDRATFGGVSFNRAVFQRGASFEHTTFDDHASFHRVAFHYIAMFRRAAFHGTLTFESAEFSKAGFARAVFHDSMLFNNVSLGREPNFDDARATATAFHAWPPGWHGVPLDDGWLSLAPDDPPAELQGRSPAELR
jgi:uncharacterized protein YjbI with pentapeptide repeats